MNSAKLWRLWVVRVLLGLWGLQVVWLAWHFGPEAGALVRQMAHRDAGLIMRQEKPLYLWAQALKAVIPPGATYVFLDDYAAGKAIQMRYFLAPRRHILKPPNLPASFLFYTLHQENADFLLLREHARGITPRVQAALASPAMQQLKVPGPGETFRVDAGRLRWGFYD
jgi:hypothetical protein